jgi:hypothetical protein
VLHAAVCVWLSCAIVAARELVVARLQYWLAVLARNATLAVTVIVALLFDRFSSPQAAIRNTRGVYRDLTAAIQPLQVRCN